MKKAWKIGISTIAGIVGACVLIRIHNAQAKKVLIGALILMFLLSLFIWLSEKGMI